jgi:hypothetical protein
LRAHDGGSAAVAAGWSYHVLIMRTFLDVFLAANWWL